MEESNSQLGNSSIWLTSKPLLCRERLPTRAPEHVHSVAGQFPVQSPPPPNLEKPHRLASTDITMDLWLAGHCWTRWACSCLLLLLLSRAGFSTPCQLDPPGPSLLSLLGAGNCSHAHCSVASGGFLHLQLPSPRPPTVDLYKWHNASRTWDHAYSFFNETAQQLLDFFQGRVSLSGGNFAAQNVSHEDEGDYKFQDLDGKCLAWLHLTVLDPVDPTDPADPVTWRWYLLFILLLIPVVLAVVAWKLKYVICRRWPGAPKKTETEEATNGPSNPPNQSQEGGHRGPPPIPLTIHTPDGSPP
nr:uncharacterized protein LOC106731965 isoform X2 [Pelodiscus sinensis]|eukprot:XP_025040020.1 uncharacterized protein LOC106731965 isoform X2 [Pelodiscus sinensis]